MAKEKKIKKEESTETIEVMDNSGLFDSVSSAIIDDEVESDKKVLIPKNTELMEKSTVSTKKDGETELINCLSNETVIVRFIKKARGVITDPRHVLYGNMAPKSKIKLPTPLLRSGLYADVLTKDEKNFLEWKLGLEPNALSVYNRTNNFWDDSNPLGIGTVELTKGDNYFDKSKPEDYIKLAILRNYNDLIAPSLQALQDAPKATYRFVIINAEDTAKEATVKVTAKAQAYKEFGKIEDDKDKMRTIIELIDGRPTAANNKLDFLQGKIGELIESNTKLFLNTVQDPLLDNKILIKKAIEAGVISKRGNYFYYRKDNTPLCDSNQEPTLNIAAKYLGLPKNQELKFKIEAEINSNKE